MKNKEIEELLNKFKIADSQQFNELVEDFNNVYKLLSYIEQLEEENKYLKQLCQTQNNREYRSKFLKEFQKEHGKNVFPDYDEIYKRYDRLKEKIEQLEKDKQILTRNCNIGNEELKNLRNINKQLRNRNEINIDRNIESYKIVEQLENNRDKAIDKIQLLIDIGFDYDGFNKVESLKGLIDELVSYAIESRDILKGDNK